MTTFLQRLVGNARGAPQAAARRIEPLLASRFAATQGRDGIPVLHEVQAEPSAPVPGPIAAQQPTGAAAIPGHGSTIDSPPSVHSLRSTHPNDLPVDETPQANTSPTSAELAPPSRVPVEQVRKDFIERDVVPPILCSAAITTPGARMPPRAITEPASPSQTVAPQAPAIEEHTQTITISIGRVEVRNAPAPAPAPARRAPFKPGVSLDAFLGRGGSGGR